MVLMRSTVYIEQKHFSEEDRVNIRNQAQMFMTVQLHELGALPPAEIFPLFVAETGTF
jgi:hypothetical protein